MAKLLLENGAQADLVDTDGQSALMYASSRGHCKIVELLLQWGAKIDLQNNTGESALMCACKHMQYDVVSLLLERGASMNLQSKQLDTALSLALLKESSKLIILLESRIKEVSEINAGSKLVLPVLAGRERSHQTQHCSPSTE